MPRVSIKGRTTQQTSNLVNVSKKRVWNCAVYEYLSREDEDIAGEPNSISDQKQLLADYCKQHGFKNTQHYTDDGTTGMRFDRESFAQLIADVEADKINATICKDMSRIGRDYVQVGMYLEIFRRKGVRFIAINNSVDSKDQATLEFAPFINIMNEWYSWSATIKPYTTIPKI